MHLPPFAEQATWWVKYLHLYSGDMGAVEVEANKGYFRMPFDATLQSIRASQFTAPNPDPTVLDVKLNGVSIFDTNFLTIDALEKTSVTSAVTPTIFFNEFENDSIVTVDVTATGGGTGLIVVFFFTPNLPTL